MNEKEEIYKLITSGRHSQYLYVIYAYGYAKKQYFTVDDLKNIFYNGKGNGYLNKFDDLVKFGLISKDISPHYPVIYENKKAKIIKEVTTYKSLEFYNFNILRSSKLDYSSKIRYKPCFDWVGFLFNIDITQDMEKYLLDTFISMGHYSKVNDFDLKLPNEGAFKKTNINLIDIIKTKIIYDLFLITLGELYFGEDLFNARDYYIELLQNLSIEIDKNSNKSNREKLEELNSEENRTKLLSKCLKKYPIRAPINVPLLLNIFTLDLKMSLEEFRLLTNVFLKFERNGDSFNILNIIQSTIIPENIELSNKIKKEFNCDENGKKAKN